MEGVLACRSWMPRSRGGQRSELDSGGWLSLNAAVQYPGDGVPSGRSRMRGRGRIRPGLEREAHRHGRGGVNHRARSNMQRCIEGCSRTRHGCSFLENRKRGLQTSAATCLSTRHRSRKVRRNGSSNVSLGELIDVTAAC